MRPVGTCDLCPRPVPQHQHCDPAPAVTVPPIAELDERHRGAWVIVQHPRRGQLVGWLFDAPSAAFELPAGHRRLYIDQPSGAVTVCDLPDSDVVELVTG